MPGDQSRSNAALLPGFFLMAGAEKSRMDSFSASFARRRLLPWSAHPTRVVRLESGTDDGASPGPEAAGVIV